MVNKIQTSITEFSTRFTGLLIIMIGLLVVIPMFITDKKVAEPIGYKSNLGKIIKVNENTVTVSYSVTKEKYESDVVLYKDKDKLNNVIEIYYNTENPKEIVRANQERKVTKNEIIPIVISSLVIISGAIMLFRPGRKRPTKGDSGTILMLVGLVGFVVISIGISFIISSNLNTDEYYKVKGVILQSFPGDVQLEPYTIIKYQVEGEQYSFKSKYYKMSDFDGKHIDLYVAKNNHLDVRQAGASAGYIVCIIVGVLLTSLGLIPSIQRIKKHFEKKYLLKNGKKYRLPVKSLMYNRKEKVGSMFTQYAELEFIDGETTYIYTSDTYINLIAYSEQKPIKEADIYIDPLDNTKYVVVFDFEKK